MRHLTLYLLTTVWLLLSGVTLVGCSHSDEPCREEVWEGDLNLVLDVGVVEPGSFPTRALNDESYFEQSSLSEEKLRSLRVIIIDSEKDEVVHNEYFTRDTPGLRISGMRFKVDFSTQYRIFLIANELGLPSDTKDLLNTTEVGKSGLSDVLKNCVVAGSVLIDNNINDEHLPIPMTEIYDIITVDMPNTSQENVKVEMKKSFFVTRAASKFSFRFFKKEGYTPEDNNLAIQSIKISGLGGKEYLFPTATVYDPAKEVESSAVGREITSFGVPSDASVSDFVFKPQFPINVKDLQENGTQYSPLYYFLESKGTDDKLSCSISYDGETYLAPVELPNLPHALPRNTHVIVNITVGDEGALLFEVEVLPWTPQYHEVDFTDHIGIAEDGTLEFVPGTYASLDKQTARLVLNDYPQAVSASFGISTPIGAKWYAYLITTAGEMNAIQFEVKDAEGKTATTNTLSGIIDGKKNEFKVRATSSASNQLRAAQLQIIVTMADGLSVPVNILKSTEYGEKAENITFVQNPQ